MTAYQQAAASCFFNALLREWPHWTLIRAPEPQFVIRQGASRLCLPCRHFSQSGRHLIGYPLQLDDKAVSFDQALAWLLDHPELRALTDAPRSDAFFARVGQSTAQLRHSLEAAKDKGIFTRDLDFIGAESALVVGHSIHPCPKARDGFSETDNARYSPEGGQSFPLCWYQVRQERLHQSAPAGIDRDRLLAELAPPVTAQQGYSLLPCHPFQHRLWQQDPALAPLLAKGDLIYLGEDDGQWRATSSVRAIWHPKHPWMLKFSLSVRLTNSLRHLQPAEFARGATLCEVLAAGPLADLERRYPDFALLREPLGLGILDDQGQLLPQTMVLWRDNPFRGQGAQQVEVLATLLQDDPDKGLSRLAQRLYQQVDPQNQALLWFALFLEKAVEPLLYAQAEHGLLFGAHQQNIVLALDQGLPAKAWFRDCQGTGFTGLAQTRYGHLQPGFAEASQNLLADQMGTKLFSYYLIINATFNVISSLAGSGLGAEDDYLWQLKAFLKRLKLRNLSDPQVLDYLLTSPELWAKGNFRCALQGINENTMADPLALYHPMDNPLIAL
ncbi:IucA/IucC family protein [Gallaecimonas xiamenensis]|uniref:IucA/IucC family protein n=1 Tax=Gallaecimonas xiamenensis 3-C-1 TaxID=745411 RepID=K2J6S0_9GAMM|nr:IucA/IucC family protein [Gallaecimonas xiamenensis]EKE70617.1 IucA/IucC family protein [Gallaecimonas xiamenensis 3-C-1]